MCGEIHDSPLLHFIQKFKSLIPWRVETMENNTNDRRICSLCEKHTLNSDLKHHCQSCGSLLCGNCVKSGPTSSNESGDSVFCVKSCNLCFELSPLSKSGRRWSGKIYPSESPRDSPEPPSPSFSDEGCGGFPPLALARSSDVSILNQTSPVSAQCSTSRSDEDEGENSTSHFFTEYLHDASSDVDSSSVSTRHEFYSVMSLGTSPSDSPFVQPDPHNNQAVLEKPGNTDPEPLDFETNGPIWFPPQPDDISDEVDDNLFTYDDEDEGVGYSGAAFFPTANIDAVFSVQQNRSNNKEPLRAEVEGHFRALVSQFLQGQNGKNDESGDGWVDVVTAIAWQAAKYLKPDTSQGGSMDPCDYLKVKCVASGSPHESKLIKGVACTKNIKHKRMTSQYKNARLLLLRGALEYQRVPNQLASFETLLQQENDQLKTIVSKIEALRPNVLLVEKSVSSFALEHLLAKDISLVLNVKRPLLEKIARCTGASITPSTDHISTTRLGHCELFHLERVSEDHEAFNQFNKKPSKTLMFFEGCPRRLGCTVVLRGSSREELKKVKHVVQYAVFAAYHLLLETSFLADEGASLPKTETKSPRFLPEKSVSTVPDPAVTSSYNQDLSLDLGSYNSLPDLGDIVYEDVSVPDEFRCRKALSEACNENLALDGEVEVAQVEDGEYFLANDNQQSILVSFSSHCMVNGTHVCERSRLLRLKFYGPSDKPLGRYLRDDLFDQSYLCRSCKEPAESHVMCYTHQNANLTVNVRRLPSVKLRGEKDGKIWMWHRCLKCPRTEGVPPATPRVVMSDSAWGLSFGKFLELSFTNHATGNRVASCGHSLQRDCLRFYGFGNMVAFFRYSPINILSVRLPPSVLEFGGPGEQDWIRNEANELLSKANALHAKISGVLEEFKSKHLSSMDESSEASDLHDHFLELNDMVSDEKTHYEDLLQFTDNEIPDQVDILEINRLRHSLLASSHVWDRRLILLDSLLKRSSSSPRLKDSENMSESPKFDECPNESPKLEPDMQETYKALTFLKKEDENTQQDDENAPVLERGPSAGSILSDKIDSAWSGIADMDTISADVFENPTFRRLKAPTRVYSFDSAQRLQERMTKGLPPSSLYLSAVRSFHASGDFRYMVRDPVATRSYSQVQPREADVFPASFISPVSILPEGARLMLPQNGNKDVIVIYDNEPTSIISYALSSKEYEDWLNGQEGGSNVRFLSKVNSLASDFASWQSLGSLDLDYMNYGSYTSEDASNSSYFADQSSSPHLRISFEDESSGRVKFSVTSYFAKQFDLLRRKCCTNEVDFVRSMSRCKRWSAQGGKSNVYFAKSFDERFIIKQVTKTELASFEEFAAEYFKYLTDALTSGSPTCLAKILGIFQVTVKHMKGGKEVKMDLMVMENLLYKRSISKVYDLKGSSRSRYNSDTTGANKVLLDMNLLETLRTNPIFLGSKAKRNLERAVWNDTSFLASVDVMDYSLLVGVDEEGKELVMGIIDFVRQYTWDKHLETWVKASGILGGPKNTSPTIISPKQYKKRFRKAMTTYFLTVPDQWPSS